VKGTYDPKVARRVLQDQAQGELVKQLEAAKAL
jgi:hypothetical protein